jgi:hypothetical protein
MWPTQPPIKWVSGSFSDKIVGARNWPLSLERRLKWAKHYPYSPYMSSYYGRRQLSVIHLLSSPPPLPRPSTASSLWHRLARSEGLSSVYHYIILQLRLNLLPWRCISTVHSNFGAILTADVALCPEWEESTLTLHSLDSVQSIPQLP